MNIDMFDIICKPIFETKIENDMLMSVHCSHLIFGGTNNKILVYNLDKKCFYALNMLSKHEFIPYDMQNIAEKYVALAKNIITVKRGL